MRRYLIIGSGVTGIAAVEAIHSLDSSGEITVVTDDPFGYYSRPGLAYYLTGELSEKQLFPLMKTDIKKMGVKWINANVRLLSPSEHSITLEDGSQATYDRLLLATGSLASGVDIPGNNLKGVVKLDNFQDAKDILKHLRKSRSAVVTGGGITALEIVEGFQAKGVKVHYLLRGDRYWKSVLDESESRIVEKRLQQEGVKIHYHTEVTAILGKNGSVVGVQTRDGESLTCNIVAMAIGVEPRKDLAEVAGLKTERGIVVSETLQTSAPDIFAAGDVAQVYDPYSGRNILDTLWPTARQQGHIAGINMTGQSRAYHKTVPYNVTRLAGLTTTIIGTVGRGGDQDLVGIARGESETWRYLPASIAVEKQFEINRVRIMVGEDRILGAVVMGDQTLSRPLYELISEKVNINPVRDRLVAPEKLTETILVLWAQWRENHANKKL